MYNVSEIAVPTQYPLALSGLGDINSAAYVKFEWNVLQRDYGNIVTPQDRQEMFAAFDDNNVLAAAAVNARIKARIKAATKPSAPGVDMTQYRFGPSDELFHGVPNYYIYGGALLLVLSRFFKKGQP